VTDDNTKKYSGPNLAVPPRLSPYPTSRLARATTLVDHAREIERAGASLAHQTNAQLRLIAEQIRFLQEQARRIVEQADVHLKLHRIPCSFRRLPGNVYHVYQKEDGPAFSLLSPDDYGGEPPHPYAGSYRLEDDDSWTRMDDDGSVDSPSGR
jgi:hypothetical protein